jgi:hypothetical protein
MIKKIPVATRICTDKIPGCGDERLVNRDKVSSYLLIARPLNYNLVVAQSYQVGRS